MECDAQRHQTTRSAAIDAARRSRSAPVADPRPPCAYRYGLAEHRLELHRQAHVALDLDLAAHERHGPVELAGGEVDEIFGLHRDRYVRVFRRSLAAIGLP